MFYAFISIIVPVLLYALFPWVVAHISQKSVKRDTALLVACLVYFVSWYIPSPMIEGRNTSFMTHLVGGIFSGFLWLWLKNQLAWKLTFWQEGVTLYAVVSTLGVTNELFEWLIKQLGLVTRINSADAWWDFVANTLGVIIFWIFYKAFSWKKK